MKPYESQPYDLGVRIYPYEPFGHYSLLAHTLALHPEGIALEFGVGGGTSLHIIETAMPVIGFDSFNGLPEDWRDGFPAGSFACGRPRMDELGPNTAICQGMFADAYPTIHSAKRAGFIHIDCDLYSSTTTVLQHLARDRRHLAPGTYIVFDEWHGYEGAEHHEQRAWREFAAETGINWEVIGHGHEAWSIKIV